MTRVASFAVAVAVALALASCSPSSGPKTGGQTNWLVACDSSQECGGFECLCGACMALCESDAACADLPGASCVAPSDEPSIAICGGEAPRPGLCLPRDPVVRVAIDSSVRHQTLVGFGASLSYADDAIVAHPKKEALYDLLFAESGFDVLRLRNRYEGSNGAALRPAREIVTAASARLGRRPPLFMTSGTPPPALKANGSRTCAGDPERCTLASLPGGSFNYSGFAGHWRASLEAYANAGILPDYVSIQNNPNWVPPANDPKDACRFLPEEGVATVSVDGAPVEVAYPGYREALSSVRAAMAALPVVPRLLAPEASGLGAVADYVPLLGASALDALALHLYGVDAMEIDPAALAAVRALAARLERPVFQTEMQAEGLETAILIHHALTSGGASAYLQNDIVGLTPDVAKVALVRLTPDGFEAQGPYYALSQYAKHTDPGWVRVEARVGSTGLLGSAWLSPGEDALTVVLVNPTAEGLRAELDLPAELRSRLVRTAITRTIFDGSERAAELGALPAGGVVTVPDRSIATVTFAID